MTKRPPLRKRLADFLLRRRRRRRCSFEGWELPPEEEDALVPAGPPRRPLPSGAVALELPREPQDVDAYGFDPSEGEGPPASAAAA